MTRSAARVAAIAAGTVAALVLIGWLLWPSPPSAAALHGGTARYALDATVDPPRMGDAQITIDLTGSGAPHGTVSVEAVMPLMGFATPALPATSTGGGHYTVANVPLMMTGPWELHVSVAAANGTDELTLPFTVSG